MPQQVTRLFLVFSLFLVVFFVIRSFLVPESWGEFGHYRGNALREIAAKETKYVDVNTCIKCHKENAELLAGGEHASIKCQTCHGPGYKHNQWHELHPRQQTPDTSMSNSVPDSSIISDAEKTHEDSSAETVTSDTVQLNQEDNTPEEFKMVKNDDREFCLKCHRKNASKPAKVIKQIDITDHYNVKKKCVKCHKPHAPNS